MTKILFSESFNFGKFTVFDSIPSVDFLQTRQTHSNIILEENTPNLMACEGDGIISKTLSTPLVIKTADCLPILVIGENGASLIHAGWRGVANKILIQDKIKALNPNFFYIGPSIGACCFEVQEDFKQEFPKSKSFIERDNKLFFDLETEVKEQIYANFGQVIVKSAKTCTHCSTIGLHSFRKNKTDKRNWNMFIPKEKR